MLCPSCHRQYPGELGVCPDDASTLTLTARIDLVPHEPCAETGVVLGDRYRIRGFLGKGGMARVLLAEDLRTTAPVAVKVLGPPAARDPTGRERFMREARAATAIGHPHIAAVIDTGFGSDGGPYIVVEYLHGETLGELMRRGDSLETARALRLLTQVTSALGGAHAAQIVHRDAKPDNLFLLGKRGAPYEAKVLDFGLAKLLAEGAFTAAGMAVGTMEYMAPEQAVTDPPEARTDIYGLGVVMYRMFTGRLPFPACAAVDLLARHVWLRPEPPRALAPELDRRIDAIVMKALRKRPANRYPSMAALGADLERVLDLRPGPIDGEAPDREPDVYEAQSDAARAAVAFFGERLRARV